MNTLITSNTTGDSFVNIIASYYGLTESDLYESDDFKWTDIIDFVINDLKVNRIEAVSGVNFGSKFNPEILNNSSYPKIESEVSYISLLYENTVITVPDNINKVLIQRKTNKLYAELNTLNYQNVSSVFFPNYIQQLIREKNKSPYFSSKDFNYGGGVKQSIQLTSVSARVFVVSKALKNKVVNLSPYLLDCHWNENENGGNFSFTLANITAEYTNNSWKKRNHSVIQSFGNLFQYTHNDALNAYRILNREYSSQPVDSIRQNYFDAILQPFDYVFIRGERLFNENNEKNIDILETCDISDLVNKNWDLIGKIDITQSDFNISNGIIGFNVQGRDLSCLTIEEQTLVLPNVVSDGGDTKNLSQFLSTFVNLGKSATSTKSANRLFGRIQDIAITIKQPIPRIMDWLFDKLANTPFATQYTLFSEFKANNPYKSFDEINWQSLKKEGEYYRSGIWNLISVWYDNSIKDRFIQDASLATMNGNMISFIKKVCLPPLVEFYSSTFGSYYHWIIRKPPFAKNDYYSLFKNCNIDGSHVISSDRIINLNLSWDNQEIYTIFRFVPIQLPVVQNLREYMYPAIAIPELMDRFGAKLWEVSSNYMDVNNIDQSFAQATADLQWVIETQIYRMFSRKGQITIIGDRAIKKGQAIYIESMDLLCYVTATSNQYTINESEVTRTTTLSIERCIRLVHYDKYFDICDFSKLYDNVNKQNKIVSLRKDSQGNPYIFDFFEQRKDLDYDNVQSINVKIEPKSGIIKSPSQTEL